MPVPGERDARRGAAGRPTLSGQASLTGFLRFWMARQSYDLTMLADDLTMLADRLLERDVRHDLTSTDSSPR